MKRWIILILALLAGSGITQAQSGLLKKLKDKVKDRVEQRTDEGMDRGIDKVEEKAKEKAKNKEGKEKGENDTSKGKDKKSNRKSEEELNEEKSGVASSKSEPAQTSPSLKSYSRYDFVPGDQLLYAEDFSQDVIGEFPLKWTTDNRGEVQTLEGIPGKWFRMYHGSRFISPALKKLPDNYTIEFDVVMAFKNEGYVYPEFEMKFFESLAGDANGRKYLQEDMNYNKISSFGFLIHPDEEASSSIKLSSRKKGDPFFDNNPKNLPQFDAVHGKPQHIAIWVQKERVRLWINAEKVFDIPQAVPDAVALNRFDFALSSSIQKPEDLGLFVTNLRVAAGAPDMRSKLITEGKLVTTGILFNVNSDKIKPESYGVLKEIAQVLKENAAVKVNIVGHTDGDGENAPNLDLSKRRAAAVKQALVKEFGIDESRMTTDGKGESQPVGDNNTSEGKAKNRRVEFIKL